jgi:hypothetical protein
VTNCGGPLWDLVWAFHRLLMTCHFQQAASAAESMDEKQVTPQGAESSEERKNKRGTFQESGEEGQSDLGVDRQAAKVSD